MRFHFAKQIPGLCLWLLAVVQLHAANPIAVTRTFASSELVSYQRLAAHSVDGKFAADGTPTDMGSVWESSGIFFGSPQDDRAPIIGWDFGQFYRIETLEVWNFWESSPAIKRAVIEQSDDGERFTEIREVIIAPWTTQFDPTRLSFTNVVARVIRMRVLESYGGDIYPVAIGSPVHGFGGFAGLAEVRFWGVPANGPAIYGFKEWYRADSAQFTALADGQPISNWQPEEGSSATPNITQYHGQEIVFRRSVPALHGQPALEFPGGPSAIRDIGKIDFNGLSMFLVFRNIGSGDLQRPLAGMDSNTLMGPWNPSQAGRYNPAIHLNGVWKIHPVDVVGWIDPGTCVLSVVINDTDTERSYINGVEIDSTFGRPGPMDTSGIGRLSFNGSGEIYKGYIAEFILYKRTLSPDETERVHDYLLVKYGLRTVIPTGPAIAIQPASQTVSAKQSVEFRVTATGSEPLTYQWRRDGNEINAATNAALQLDGVTTNVAGSYTVAISNAAGTITSEAAILTVNRLPQAISFQELPFKLIGAAPFSLDATSSSALPLSFFSAQSSVATIVGNVVTIAGEGITDITASQAGDATYLPAMDVTQSLAVFAPVTIQGPTNRLSVGPGEKVTIAVTASGSPPLSYQWRFNGVPLTNDIRISGADSATLSIAAAVAEDMGDYDVVVGNVAGMATSAISRLTVTGPVAGFQEWYRADSAQFSGLADGQAISNWQPEAGSSARPNMTQYPGQEIVYRKSVAELKGKPALEFPGGPSAIREIAKVDFNGVSLFLVFRNVGSGGLQRPLAGMDSNTLMGPWNPAQAGRYNPVIHLNGAWKIHPEDVIGWIDPAACLLSVVINATDTERSYINGVGIKSSHGSPGPMDTTGIGRLSFNGSGEIFKGYIAEFILYKRALSVDETDRVHDYLIVKYGLRNTPPMAPTIAVSPVSQSVPAKQNVEFHVTATGTDPLAYQWQKDGKDIEGATSVTLLLNNVTTNAAGSYGVRVTNAGGSISSEPAVLTVNRLAQAIAFPEIPFKLTGADPFSLDATASSGLPVSFVSDQTAVATVAGYVLSVVAEGMTTITARQSGDATYLPAPEVSRLLSVYAPVSFTSPNNGLFAQIGQTIFDAVTVSGTPPFTFQWRHNGTPLTNSVRILGADSSTLAIVGLTPADAGDYDVVVSNPVSSKVSGVDRLVVVSVDAKIRGITATATSELSRLGRNASNALNGIYCDGNFWESVGSEIPGSEDRAPAMTFDFGGVFQLDGFEIWNSHEFGPAIKRMEVKVSMDGINYISKGITELMAPAGCPPTPELRQLGGVSARFVRFEVLENYAGVTFPVVGAIGGNMYVAIDEVEFFGAKRGLSLGLDQRNGAFELLVDGDAELGTLVVYRAETLDKLKTDRPVTARINTAIAQGMRFPIAAPSAGVTQEYFMAEHLPGVTSTNPTFGPEIVGGEIKGSESGTYSFTLRSHLSGSAADRYDLRIVGPDGKAVEGVQWFGSISSSGQTAAVNRDGDVLPISFKLPPRTVKPSFGVEWQPPRSVLRPLAIINPESPCCYTNTPDATTLFGPDFMRGWQETFGFVHIQDATIDVSAIGAPRTLITNLDCHEICGTESFPGGEQTDVERDFRIIEFSGNQSAYSMIISSGSVPVVTERIVFNNVEFAPIDIFLELGCDNTPLGGISDVYAGINRLPETSIIVPDRPIQNIGYNIFNQRLHTGDLTVRSESYTLLLEVWSPYTLRISARRQSTDFGEAYGIVEMYPTP